MGTALGEVVLHLNSACHGRAYESKGWMALPSVLNTTIDGI